MIARQTQIDLYDGYKTVIVVVCVLCFAETVVGESVVVIKKLLQMQVGDHVMFCTEFL